MLFYLFPFVYLKFPTRSVVSKVHQSAQRISITWLKLTNQGVGIVLLHITRKRDCKIFRFVIGQFWSRDGIDKQHLQIYGFSFEAFCLPVIFVSIDN